MGSPRGSGTPAVRGSGSAQEARALELLGDLLDGDFDVRRLARARADQLSTAEQQDHDLRHVNPADEAGELFGLVLDPVESERDRDRVQVDLALEVRARDDVLDLDLGLHVDLLTALLDLGGDGVDRLLDLVHAFCTGADDLARPEEQDRRLRLLQSVDQTGKLLGLVFRAIQPERDRLQVELVPEGSRRYDVFDPNLDQRNPRAREYLRRYLKPR